ncbi:MAG: helix-turn-helix transcriptional regulator [Prevotella sp.]|nr:helix-turn-helix domain-containing protein [Prevotella sp.]MDD6863324.1 helix-turn-helix transcriptional regulator [Prevotella sp.]MDD7224897.1 helix-turn-helix transcriptional regulator [Prevotella sp.]
MKERIRELMESLHKSQQDFAQFIEMSPASLSSIFNGRTKPTLTIVEAIKKKIPDISVEWLLFGVGDMYANRQATATSQESPTPTSSEPMLEFDFDDEAKHSRSEKNADQTVNSNNSVKRTRLENKENEVKSVDIVKRRVIEIRVYYDDYTFETFVPDKR